jgi:hypothetical protein
MNSNQNNNKEIINSWRIIDLKTYDCETALFRVAEERNAAPFRRSNSPSILSSTLLSISSALKLKGWSEAWSHTYKSLALAKFSQIVFLEQQINNLYASLYPTQRLDLPTITHPQVSAKDGT